MTAGWCCSTTCCGSSPTCASSTRGCWRRPGRGRRDRQPASPAPTRAAGRGGRRCSSRARPSCAPRRVLSRSTRRSSARSRPAISCCPRRVRHRRARGAATMSDTGGESTDFLYPFIEGDERDAARAARQTSQRRRWRRPTASAALRAATLGADRVEQRRRSGRHHGGAVRRRRPAVHVRQRRQLDRCGVAGRRCSPGRRGGARCRRGAWSTTRRSSPRSATTSASTWCSPASSSLTVRPATSPSASRPAATRATCSPRSPRPRARGHAHGRPRRLRRRRDGGAPRRAALPRRRSDSVHRIQETQAALGFALVGGASRQLTGRAVRWLTPSTDDAKPRSSTASRRSAAAARASTDEVVTLAHGAGGKASAALVDAVFLDAFADGDAGPARPTPRRWPCPRASGWRSAPTRSSCSHCASRADRSVTSPCTAP